MCEVLLALRSNPRLECEGRRCFASFARHGWGPGVYAATRLAVPRFRWRSARGTEGKRNSFALCLSISIYYTSQKAAFWVSPNPECPRQSRTSPQAGGRSLKNDSVAELNDDTHGISWLNRKELTLLGWRPLLSEKKGKRKG